jgi:hypothetical protein
MLLIASPHPLLGGRLTMATKSAGIQARERAEVSDKHSAALIATGSVTATVGGAFITVTALEPGRPLRPIWANAWFDIGFACAIVGLVLAAFGLYLNFRRQARTPPAASATEPVPGPAADGPASAFPPLVVKVLTDSRFVGWRQAAMIAALHVEIENTNTKDIMIDGYEFTCDNEGEPIWDHQTSAEERISLLQEIKRRDENAEHGHRLRDITRISSRNRISGWLLMPVSRNSGGGTPGCTVAVRDVLGNRYLAKLPRQEPRTYDPVSTHPRHARAHGDSGRANDGGRR